MLVDKLKLEPSFDIDDEEFSIPLCIDDILSICREYNKLGEQIQQQVETILEIGIEESIRYNHIKVESLNQIKSFLIAINSNCYFGDAATQAKECINLIDAYQKQLKIKEYKKLN